jgi:hypothetical protein
MHGEEGPGNNGRGGGRNAAQGRQRTGRAGGPGRTGPCQAGPGRGRRYRLLPPSGPGAPESVSAARATPRGGGGWGGGGRTAQPPRRTQHKRAARPPVCRGGGYTKRP